MAIHGRYRVNHRLRRYPAFLHAISNRVNQELGEDPEHDNKLKFRICDVCIFKNNQTLLRQDQNYIRQQ